MILSLLLSFSLLTSDPPTTLTIDFADYHSAIFNQYHCSYTANDIPFHFYDTYIAEEVGGLIFCEEDEQLKRAFKGRVDRKHLPITGKTVELKITDIDCLGVEDFFEYGLFYNNGKIVKAFGESVVIKNFHKLDYLTLAEGECGLTGIPGRVGPVTIEFTVIK